MVRGLPEGGGGVPASRPLGGGGLRRGVTELARRTFGQFAPVVFREWGIASGEDVGRIVFLLVESRQLSARSEDTMDDFRHGGDLFAALTANLDFGPAEQRSGRPGRREPGTPG